jgi:hypothetical protein
MFQQRPPTAPAKLQHGAPAPRPRRAERPNAAAEAALLSGGSVGDAAHPAPRPATAATPQVRAPEGGGDGCH